MTRHALAALLVALAIQPTAFAHDIVRRASQDFPIASSVAVPAGTDLVFVSGTLADAADPKAPAGSIERMGDTATQAKSVLAKIEKELATAGMALQDVVKMNVFLVGDPGKGVAMDFEGLMQAYLAVYGPRARDNRLPARTTVQVVGLPVPGALVEIEVIAARHAAH